MLRKLFQPSVHTMEVLDLLLVTDLELFLGLRVKQLNKCKTRALESLGILVD